MFDNIMAVYEGREGHPLVFQPRLRHWFDVNHNAGTLPERFKGMYLDEIYENIGVAPREVWGPRRIGSELSGYFALSNIERDDVEVWTRRMKGYGDEVLTKDRKFFLPNGKEILIHRGTHPDMLLLAKYFTTHFEKLRGKYGFTEDDIQSLFFEDRLATHLGKNFYGPLVGYMAKLRLKK